MAKIELEKIMNKPNSFNLADFNERMNAQILKGFKELTRRIDELPLKEKVIILNQAREIISEASPFKNEPVDCIQWVPGKSVAANEYNPNSVAPPEMDLLRLSVLSDGYTQPIVAFPENNGFTVIDGFHRKRVGSECDDVKERLYGYLPITIINSDREGINDRMASTIRHNRARGKHAVDSMSEIVIELKRRNWSDKKIGKELGMDEDEVLRLTQISGLTEMFADKDFSEAWSAEMYDEPQETIE